MSKCVIKAKDPRLQQTDIAVLGFLNPGPRPQGVLKVEPIFQYKAKDAATPSQPATKEEEEKEEDRKSTRLNSSHSSPSRMPSSA